MLSIAVISLGVATFGCITLIIIIDKQLRAHLQNHAEEAE